MESRREENGNGMRLERTPETTLERNSLLSLLFDLHSLLLVSPVTRVVGGNQWSVSMAGKQFWCVCCRCDPGTWRKNWGPHVASFLLILLFTCPSPPSDVIRLCQIQPVEKLTKEKMVLYSKGLDEVGKSSHFALVLSAFCCRASLILFSPDYIQSTGVAGLLSGGGGREIENLPPDWRGYHQNADAYPPRDQRSW